MSYMHSKLDFHNLILIHLAHMVPSGVLDKLRILGTGQVVPEMAEVVPDTAEVPFSLSLSLGNLFPGLSEKKAA